MAVVLNLGSGLLSRDLTVPISGCSALHMSHILAGAAFPELGSKPEQLLCAGGCCDWHSCGGGI